MLSTRICVLRNAFSICCRRALVLVFMKVICEESLVENISCLDEELALGSWLC